MTQYVPPPIPPPSSSFPQPQPAPPGYPGAAYGPPPPGWPMPRPWPVALPREPGALARFWGERHQPISTVVLVACLTVGVAGGWLLVGHRLGLGAAVVGVLVWAAAVPALVRRRAVGDLITAALSVALLAVVAFRDAGWVVGLCVATAAGAGAVAATASRSVPAVLMSGLSWAAGVVRAIPWFARGLATRVGTRRGKVLAALRSVAVTVVLLVVFGLLLTSADRVFASFLPRVRLDLLPAQVVVGLLVALAAATLAQLALVPPGWSRLGVSPGRPARRGEWALPVLALDVMVLGFVLVQVSALLGGHRHVLETAGLTYAEYARSGFAQLVVVTVLTLAVVAVAARHAPRESARDRLLSRVALGVLCVATLGVVASALRRMDLYVEAFGLTRMRLFVTVFEVVLGVVLVLVLLAGVRWRGAWLPRAVVAVAAVAVLTLAAANPDALIVRHNTTADLDVEMDLHYLQGLSADAVPAMDELAEPERSCLLQVFDLEPARGAADWNLSREQALRTLASWAPVDSPCAAYYAENG